MGNSASSGRGHHEETVDFGHLTPQGIYTGPKDWNQTIVTQLIVERKLAPFYRPLEDYDESWDDEQILAARKEPPDSEGLSAESLLGRAESINSTVSRMSHSKRPSNLKEASRHPEAAIYRGAIECPICFLYYPPNINHSRCCHQAICTECFVQIKRAEPTATHLVSEPAACPYCVQENFGVVYTPPSWRTGLGSDGSVPPAWMESPTRASTYPIADNAPPPTLNRQRKSFSPDSPEVVTIDQIRPDWEQKLAAVRAAVARRANRRIIMRQVGDRLIPVGVTSGRVHALSPEEAQAEGVDGNGDRSSRRSRRRQQNQDLSQYLGSMGLGGQDLEELMIMEAMRLSLIEHEEQLRREKEEEAKKAAEGGSQDSSQTAAAGTSSTPAATEISTPSRLLPPIVPGTSFSSDVLALSSPAPNSTTPPGDASRPSSSTLTAEAPDTALNSSTSTNAVASPAGDAAKQSTLSLETITSVTNGSTSSQAHPQVVVSTTDPDTRSVEEDAAEEDSNDPSSRRAGLPIPQRMNSSASSIEPSNYDPLPSSPDSPSSTPLLDLPSSEAGAEANSSDAAATSSP